MLELCFMTMVLLYIYAYALFAGLYRAPESIRKASFSGGGQSNLDIGEVCQL